MIRILILEPTDFSVAARDVLARCGTVRELDESTGRMENQIADADVLIARLGYRLDRDVLAHGKSLKAIVTPTTGLNHIDLAYARSRRIDVLSLKGETQFLETVHATAEHTWALLLSLVRKIPWAHDESIRGKWNRDRFKGRELHGKTLGIIGLGRLGKRVSFYAGAFGMNVLGYDPLAQEDIEGVHRSASLDDLFRESDVITVHVPLEESTRRLISAREFELLRRGSFLVNTSRGEVLDEQALLAALETGRLGGAALDVVTEEQNLAGDNPLMEYARTHDDLLITPHVGGATVESMEKTEVFMAEKLASYLQGKSLLKA